MEALTIHPQNDEQLKAIKCVLKALKIPFYKSPYNPEYVKKIQESEKHQKGAVILKCEEDIGSYQKKQSVKFKQYLKNFNYIQQREVVIRKNLNMNFLVIGAEELIKRTGLHTVFKKML